MLRSFVAFVLMQHFWYLGVTEPLDPGICDFEETSSCKYFYNSTTASEYQWIRRVGMLQSGFFGPNNDAYGKINGYFMFADSFNGKSGDAALLLFAEFNIRKSSSLRFAYMIFGDGTTLNILTQTSNNISLNLWTKTGHQNYYWMKDCVHLPSYTNQNIIFVANNNVTDSGIYGYIALDNVYVEGSDCPDIDVQCDFEDEDFLCGYLNFTQWSMGNEWMVVSYNSKIDTATLNVEAGKFLWSISDRNLTYMISPELEVNAPSCVTFQYYANTTNRHTFALRIQFILENIDGSFTLPIAWVTVSVTDDKWELGQFDINENHAGIRLMIGNVLGQVGLDNIRVSPGQCKGHTCQGQFQCGNYCIDPSKVCDCVFDCPDRSDEALCYPKSKKMCESTDLYQLVCPHVWGKMVSLDKGQSFLARFQDSALLVVELGHNCSNFTTDLNKIVGDVYFQASQLKEELEYCADVTFRKLFCDSFVTYNITYADDLEIPYFKGLDIFFTDEIEQCTMKFQNFLNLKKHRINRDNMIFFLLNMTSCWEHLSFTNQQVIIISLQNNHIDTPVLFEGRMLSGMSQRYHQLIILTLVEESCIKPFYQYVQLQGYKKNESEYLLSTGNIMEFKSEFDCLKIYYQCIGDSYDIITQLIPESQMSYAEMILVVVVTIFNIFVLSIFLRKENRSPVVILLSALAISDTLTELFWCGPELLSYLFYYHQMNFKNGKPIRYLLEYPFCFWYSIVNPISDVFHMFSIFLTTISCLQKTAVLMFPLWSREHITNRVSIIGIILSFILTTVLAIPMIMLPVGWMREIDGRGCLDRELKNSTESTYRYLILVLNNLTLLCVSLVLICTVFIICKLTILRKNLPWKDHSTVTRRNRISALTIAFICIVFILSEIITSTVCVLYFLSSNETLREKLIQYRHLSLSIGFAMNFLVYLVMGQQFRQKLSAGARSMFIFKCFK